MCFSFISSITSYSIGLLAAIFAIKTQQIPLGFLILFYCQIQLAEALIWRGIDTGKLSLNKLGTTLAKYSLALHMFGLGIGIYLVYKESIPLLVGALFFLSVCLYYYYRDNSVYTYPYKSCVKRECQNNDNRLVWKFPVLWYSVFALVTMAFYFLYVKDDSLVSRIVVISFFIITALFSGLTSRKEMSFPTLWCYMSAIAAPILVLINYNLNRKS